MTHSVPSFLSGKPCNLLRSPGRILFARSKKDPLYLNERNAKKSAHEESLAHLHLTWSLPELSQVNLRHRLYNKAWLKDCIFGILGMISLRRQISRSLLLCSAGEDAIEFIVQHTECSVIFVHTLKWSKLRLALLKELKCVKTVVYWGAGGITPKVTLSFPVSACCCRPSILQYWLLPAFLFQAYENMLTFFFSSQNDSLSSPATIFSWQVGTWQ